MVLTVLMAVLLAYVLGSIPFGVPITRLIAGKNVREQGSGRTGSTNVVRSAGWPAGLLTGALDILKGGLAVNLPLLLTPELGMLPLAQALCGIAVVVGHNYSLFIGFEGGAGATPNAGAAIGLWPWAALILIPLLPIVLISTGYASVATTSGAVVTVIMFMVLAALGVTPPIYILYAGATLTLIIIALLPNYKRLAEGTERRVGPRAQ